METIITDLEVYQISTKNEITKYKTYLSQIDENNPYYKFELLNVGLKDNTRIMYFVYKKDGLPAVLMPFYLKQIIIDTKKTPYFDVSSPWGYVGPLFNKNINVNVKHFWEKVDAWYINNKVITEFVRFNFTGNHIFYSGTLIHTLKNVRGKINQEEVLWTNFNRSVRKNHRTALKSDLKYKIYYKSIEPCHIEEFYTVYMGTMDRHEANKSFYHKLEYFVDFILKNKEHCALATVYKNDIAISTELLLLSTDTVFSFLGGTNAAYFNFRPNELLKIAVLNWARENGFEYYIIGGGLADGDGLYQYKKKFFPKDDDLNFYTGRKILNLEVYQDLNKMFGSTENDYQEADITKGFFPQYRAEIK